MLLGVFFASSGLPYLPTSPKRNAAAVSPTCGQRIARFVSDSDGVVGHDHECIKPNFLPLRQKSHRICHDQFILVRFQQVLPAFERRCGEVKGWFSFGGKRFHVVFVTNIMNDRVVYVSRSETLLRRCAWEKWGWRVFVEAEMELRYCRCSRA